MMLTMPAMPMFYEHEEETEDLIRLVGRKAYIYRWSDETYLRRRASLAQAHSTTIEDIQLLCGEGWREALCEEQEEGLPLLYMRELRDRLESFGEDDLTFLAEAVLEALETEGTEAHDERG